MNFKKVFSAIVAGLITSTLFSNLSFASENQSTQQSQSGPNKIILMDKNTPKDKLKDYGLEDLSIRENKFCYYLTDESKKIYAELIMFYVKKNGNYTIEWLGCDLKGMGKLILTNVLNSYKNVIISLVDCCSICEHPKEMDYREKDGAFCYYEKFGFEFFKNTSDGYAQLILERKQDKIIYDGNQEGLRDLPIIQI